MQPNKTIELPLGWVWIDLGDIAESLQNGIYKPSKYYSDDGIACLRMYNIEDSRIVWKDIKRMILTESEVENYRLEPGDILINRVNSRELVGKAATIPVDLEECIYESKNIRFRPYKNFLESDLVTLWLRINGQAYFNRNAQQTVGMASINQEQINLMPFPLPPLNEQRRIVEKIEALTARSWKAREALEAIPELLDQFRQSVLAAAFRGDLTADWREQNPDVGTDWNLIPLSKAIHGKPRNGYSPKSVDYPTTVKSLSLSATTSGIFQSQYFKYIDEVIEDNSYLWLTPGDILIQRSNTIEYVGTSAIYNGASKEFVYPDLMMKIQVIREKAIPEFIHICLSAEQVRDYLKSKATGTAGNMPKINQKIVLSTSIPLPPIAEQKEVIKRVNQYFSILNSIRAKYEEIIIDADQLDQSILAKAFRGDLVPQDPNDEPAAVLLERIRAEREKVAAKGKKGRKKKR